VDAGTLTRSPSGSIGLSGVRVITTECDITPEWKTVLKSYLREKVPRPHTPPEEEPPQLVQSYQTFTVNLQPHLADPDEPESTHVATARLSNVHPFVPIASMPALTVGYLFLRHTKRRSIPLSIDGVTQWTEVYKAMDLFDKNFSEDYLQRQASGLQLPLADTLSHLCDMVDPVDAKRLVSALEDFAFSSSPPPIMVPAGGNVISTLLQVGAISEHEAEEILQDFNFLAFPPKDCTQSGPLSSRSLQPGSKEILLHRGYDVTGLLSPAQLSSLASPPYVVSSSSLSISGDLSWCERDLLLKISSITCAGRGVDFAFN
jgi:hypothetical protein